LNSNSIISHNDKDIFKNRILLITGGTGSFGNAVLKRFLNTDIKEIRIFSRDEKKQHYLRTKLNNPKVKYFIGDVRNYDSIFMACKGADFIFHAAALKQVPSCEYFPMEATKTNVLGTDNVLKAAVANNVRNVICLSTDKAAYPINAMGISKALMEKVAVATSRNISSENTKICLTRYGNVMASRGSVIPHFINQIKTKKPITVTDPNMTRYLMSIDDAVDLVLYAFKNGNQGDLFVQKSPASTIGDLAQAVKEIFNAPNPIKIIGTRHGEKLYETLCTREEMARATDLEDFYQIPADNRDLNYNIYYDKGDLSLSALEDYNSHNAVHLNIEKVKNILLSLKYINEQLGSI
jgi:UDP-N-acetylglucosamine 4,6-dehydratase/5-epimerase